MTPERKRLYFGPAVLALPTLYVSLLTVTVLSATTKPFAFQRIDGSNPFGGMMLMLSGNIAAIVVVYAFTGAPWWYLVGLVARLAKSRASAAGAALLSLLTFSIAGPITLETFKEDPDRALLPLSAFLQYGLLALLCLGALTSAGYALRTVVRSAGVHPGSTAVPHL